MTTVFWECESVIFVDAMPRVETIISDAYIRMLTEVTNHFRLVQRYNMSSFRMTMQDHTHLKT